MAHREQRVLGSALGSMPTTSSPEENSRYRVGDDLFILLDEVLNNSIRAILIYDEFSGRFADADAYALASVLRYNTSIISVNLCGVEIGDHAVSLLCDAMARSKVRVVDLSNTFLADEAGTALAALAHCNPNLRTVVVDETLISEELMDDIDLACQLNETKYELGPPLPIDPSRDRYCVQYCFGVCPNGDFCPLVHRSIALIGREDDASEKKTARALELPPLPKEGASWKAPRSPNDSDDETAGTFAPVFGVPAPPPRPVVADEGLQATWPRADRIVGTTLALCAASLLLATVLRSRR
jgi:hypothetical protein